SVPGVVAPVGPTVNNIVGAMMRLYAGRDLHIRVLVNASCLALCDPMDLNEMLANLIDNACKWTAKTIIILGSADDDRVVIAVEDDGPGLPADSIDVGFRVGERLDEQVPGSGLGLPIARDLAQLYGGEIRLENIAAGGLRAILRLPKAPRYP